MVADVAAMMKTRVAALFVKLDLKIILLFFKIKIGQKSSFVSYVIKYIIPPFWIFNRVQSIQSANETNLRQLDR